jgi:hypothetical protein
MEIGKEKEKITVEPIRNPVPSKEPVPEREPVKTPEPKKEPVKV